MLPQIVGLSCASCAGRIGSEVDGRFCEGCGNPVHNRCVPPRPVSNDELLSAHEVPKCPRCGGDPKTPLAFHVRGQWLGHRAWKEVEDQAPLVGALEHAQQQRAGLRIGLYASLALFCLALVLVAVRSIDGDSVGALACLGAPGCILGLYLAQYWFVGWYGRSVASKLDRALEEKERARIEKGEPPE